MAPSGPFAPSDRSPAKRINQFNVRFNDLEKKELEEEAARRGITALNLIRTFIREGLERMQRGRRG